MMTATLLLSSTLAFSAGAQTSTQRRAMDPWAGPRRGSWVREGTAARGDVVLAKNAEEGVVVVLPQDAASNLQKAAEFFRADLEKLGVENVPIVTMAPPKGIRVLVQIKPNATRPEAYTINTDSRGLTIVGTDAHGAAFGLYELSERLGIDPLYIWTGFTPKKRLPLIVKSTKFEQGPAAVRWRGLFHDDEDILPRPFDQYGYPAGTGKVPLEWYERFFETALRLRMNMVAPWVRVEKYFDVQKTASDWGLAYTSHHYDILLADPYHFNKGLAEKRGVKPQYDWFANREGIIKFWRAGVEENKNLDAIWPIGLRGTDDHGYNFPKEWTEDQRIATYNEVLAIQAGLVDELTPKGKPRLMHFTMYTEMLPYYQTGKLKVPEGATIVWPDNNDGFMRGLPRKGDPGDPTKHGVYYHLAYLGGALSKQTHQVVPPQRVESEFRKILDAGATDYILTNVSELREYVMGVRFLSDILWNGPQAFAQPDAAGRFMNWWGAEYYGEPAAKLAVDALNAYFTSYERTDNMLYAPEKIMAATGPLRRKLAGQTYSPLRPETLPTLRERYRVLSEVKRKVLAAKAAITDPEQRRFFEENVELAAAMLYENTEAAIDLYEGMQAPDRATTLTKARSAMAHLDQLQAMLRRAERPPFERWYGPTWIWERRHALIDPKEWLGTAITEGTK